VQEGDDPGDDQEHRRVMRLSVGPQRIVELEVKQHREQDERGDCRRIDRQNEQRVAARQGPEGLGDPRGEQREQGEHSPGGAE